MSSPILDLEILFITLTLLTIFCCNAHLL
ncbi:hypothetical protein FWK35_00027351 [Aphis craccivora]|uniref:Uncharacterized protein n=1 Tax=Aphis craccivora TaxID=307492 RepID=A0A6G0Y3G2_APHCR|nr:hypothetical protein FWK35_00027351 [Aphis craccivora]